MDWKYKYYQGWSRESISMERFFIKNKINYEFIHQEIGKHGIIVTPRGEFYCEEQFDILKKEMMEILN